MDLDHSASLARRSAEPARGMTSVHVFGCVVAYLILGTLTVSPLLWTVVPPLSDYPNHLARMWVLAHGREIPELASNYVAHWRAIPNLAMDLIVPPLAQIMPIEIAGRFFLALTILGLVGGTVTLHRVLHGRTDFWPLCSLLFVYNSAFFFGLLNFLFGTAAFMLAFSGWIASRNWPLILRLLTFAVAASLLYLLHLFAFGLYGLSVMSYELGRRIQGGRWSVKSAVSWCVISLQFFPAALLWLVSLSDLGPTYTAYGGMGAKVLALTAPFSFGHLVALDLEFAIFSGFFLLYGMRSGFLRIVPQMRLPLAALGSAAVFMPHWLSGSWGADIRLPVALAFLIIASTRLETSKRLPIHVFALIAGLLLAARVWAVSEAWHDYDRQVAEFRAASSVIEKGARLLVVRQTLPETYRMIPGMPTALALRADQVYDHVAALAVIDRSVFIPYLYSGWTSIAPTPRNAGLFQTSGIPITPEALADPSTMIEAEPSNRKPNGLGEFPYWGNWPNHFDYVLWIDFGERPQQLPENLEAIASGSFFRIYRVLRP
jgi:hypothetical protein